MRLPRRHHMFMTVSLHSSSVADPVLLLNWLSNGNRGLQEIYHLLPGLFPPERNIDSLQPILANWSRLDEDAKASMALNMLTGDAPVGDDPLARHDDQTNDLPNVADALIATPPSTAVSTTTPAMLFVTYRAPSVFPPIRGGLRLPYIYPVTNDASSCSVFQSAR